MLDEILPHIFQLDIYREDLLRRADAFEQAAKILRAEVPVGKPIWLKSVFDQGLGNDVMNFTADIQRHEGTSRKRDTTWAENKGKAEKRRVKNTMGYQSTSRCSSD